MPGTTTEENQENKQLLNSLSLLKLFWIDYMLTGSTEKKPKNNKIITIA
jgi:hypothetical protein